ncbi:LppP/LprE family lipoprotein [Arcanobacterium pinnipediorum]|uniref:LppP/LprE family lipoprotein n=1 Tax=Arcanobacterium pinnipediorum TaxID=1503041 RepID=A0ABY5AH18_9ACTO|nr:LppP/LprE family lipoprotein [Arcanobacterium pinnipediorum]USR79152.1 LppP/LprE family lipoprotein [Arcanobacterium pinnipediorum]
MIRSRASRFVIGLPIALLAFTGCSNCADISGTQALNGVAENITPAWEGLPADSSENWDFSAADTSTFDSCKALSWISIPTGNSGQDSPYTVALFHNGEFIRTAEARPYLGVPKVSRVSDKEIQIERPWFVDAEHTKPMTAVATYVWNEDTSRVKRTGGLPPNEFAAGGLQPTAE